MVALSAAEDLETVMRALNAAAMSFIPKSASAATLVQTLHLVLAKDIYLPLSVFLASRGSTADLTTRFARPATAGPETTSADQLGHRHSPGVMSSVICCRPLALAAQAVGASLTHAAGHGPQLAPNPARRWRRNHATSDA